MFRKSIDEVVDSLCLWKIIANNDLEKKRIGNTYYTLKDGKQCFNCDGRRYINNQNTKCEYYLSSKDMYDVESKGNE